MYQTLTNLPRWAKSGILLAYDLLAIVAAYYAALVLRLNDIWHEAWISRSPSIIAITLMVGSVLFFALRLHTIKLAGFETNAALRTALWAAILSLGGFVVNLWLFSVPRTVPLIFGPILYLLVLGARYLALGILAWLSSGVTGKTPVAIYGAGSGGLQLLAALRSDTSYKPVLLIDNNRKLQGLMISGLKVFAPEALGDAIKRFQIGTIFLAMPSITQERRRQIIEDVKAYGCSVMELPSYLEIIQSGGILKSLRPVSIDTLLGRSGVDLEMPAIRESYTGERIMVSGAGGSIGSELCRKLLEAKPEALVLFEQSEHALYQIELELRTLANEAGTELIAKLGSVTDRKRVQQVLSQDNMSVVFHAAAYKHVPLTERNELACIRNNVLGTQVLAQEAARAGIKRFTLVSTDKAVRPTSVMGASKRLAELVVQDQQARTPGTCFASVRFGNVLGSSGSVIPLFKKQIEDGGPITVTHENVTRYFMTIPEAAQLVLLAGSFAEGADVFLLDMGEPVKIIELARQMIELSGLSVKDGENPDGDIEICITGLREGEKLYEELLIDAETLPTPHPKILRARETRFGKRQFSAIMKKLEAALEDEDALAARKILSDHAGLVEEGHFGPASRSATPA
ncbi:polysaccharide biosynthesis protein [Salaquimonas pukyongi]|uniref:polysaccharide biosynthesis protein n=1 Tax=Salaquimonas pukyongi TaxID=2712698 RepID=UPI00096BA542|nr:nucleoside-diphosphate sugar epimerase/dehydratase [Salaquimonas pukyongi]